MNANELVTSTCGDRIGYLQVISSRAIPLAERSSQLIPWSAHNMSFTEFIFRKSVHVDHILFDYSHEACFIAIASEKDFEEAAKSLYDSSTGRSLVDY